MLKKVKNWLGIEGVQLEFLNIPEKVESENMIVGSIRLTSKSDQFITDISVTVKEKYTRGRRKSKLTDEFEIGSIILPVNLELSTTESQEIKFDVPYQLLKSEIETWGDKNVLYKGVSKAAQFFKNAKSKYFVLVEANVKGNRLKPYVIHEINL